MLETVTVILTVQYHETDSLIILIAQIQLDRTAQRISPTN